VTHSYSTLAFRLVQIFDDNRNFSIIYIKIKVIKLHVANRTPNKQEIKLKIVKSTSKKNTLLEANNYEVVRCPA